MTQRFIKVTDEDLTPDTHVSGSLDEGLATRHLAGSTQQDDSYPTLLALPQESVEHSEDTQLPITMKLIQGRSWNTYIIQKNTLQFSYSPNIVNPFLFSCLSTEQLCTDLYMCFMDKDAHAFIPEKAFRLFRRLEYSKVDSIYPLCGREDDSHLKTMLQLICDAEKTGLYEAAKILSILAASLHAKYAAPYCAFLSLHYQTPADPSTDSRNSRIGLEAVHKPHPDLMKAMVLWCWRQICTLPDLLHHASFHDSRGRFDAFCGRLQVVHLSVQEASLEGLQPNAFQPDWICSDPALAFHAAILKFLDARAPKAYAHPIKASPLDSHPILRLGDTAEEILQLLQQAADGGHVWASLLVASAYESGYGGVFDPDLGRAMFSDLADLYPYVGAVKRALEEHADNSRLDIADLLLGAIVRYGC